MFSIGLQWCSQIVDTILSLSQECHVLTECLPRFKNSTAHIITLSNINQEVREWATFAETEPPHQSAPYWTREEGKSWKEFVNPERLLLLGGQTALQHQYSVAKIQLRFYCFRARRGGVMEGYCCRRAYLCPHGILQILHHPLSHYNKQPR